MPPKTCPALVVLRLASTTLPRSAANGRYHAAKDWFALGGSPVRAPPATSSPVVVS